MQNPNIKISTELEQTDIVEPFADADKFHALEGTKSVINRKRFNLTTSKRDDFVYEVDIKFYALELFF